MTPDNMLKHASQFNLGRRSIDGTPAVPVYISKQTRGWFVTAVAGPLAPFNLGADMVWRYKAGTPFTDVHAAFAAFERAMQASKWDDGEAIEASADDTAEAPAP